MGFVKQRNKWRKRDWKVSCGLIPRAVPSPKASDSESLPGISLTPHLIRLAEEDALRAAAAARAGAASKSRSVARVQASWEATEHPLAETSAPIEVGRELHSECASIPADVALVHIDEAQRFPEIVERLKAKGKRIAYFDDDGWVVSASKRERPEPLKMAAAIALGIASFIGVSYVLHELAGDWTPILLVPVLFGLVKVWEIATRKT